MVQENRGTANLNETHAFFLAVKKGELTTIRGYIDNGGVDINTPDKDGNTALYWACLCNQPDVVTYLLQKAWGNEEQDYRGLFLELFSTMVYIREEGAEYDSSSSSGERTFLAAQNPDIRKILHATSNKGKAMGGKGKGGKGKGKNNNLPKSGIQYDDFLKRLLVLRPHTDLEITTSVNDGEDTQVLHAHRFVIQARCKHLVGKVETKNLNLKQWEADTVNTLLKYLYSGELECPLSRVEQAIDMLKELNMGTLANDLLEASKTNNSKLDVLYIKKEAYRKQLQKDFQLLALQGIPKVFARKVAPQTFHLGISGAMYQDAIFYVEDLDFRVHRVFLEDRSEHFKNLFQHHLDEKLSRVEKMPVVVLSDVQPEVFANIMMYLYTDEIRLTENNTPGILMAALKYKIHSLTQQLLKTAGDMLTCHNLPFFYNAAMETKNRKLIEICLSFMGEYLMKLLHRTTFRELLVESWKNSSVLFDQLEEVIAGRCHRDEISETQACEQVEKLNEVLCALHIKPIRNRYLPDENPVEESEDSSSSSGSDTSSETSDEENEDKKEPSPKPKPTTASPSLSDNSKTSIFRFNYNQEQLERLERELIVIARIRDKSYAEPLNQRFYPSINHPEVVSSKSCTKSRACVIQ